jgi:hypothetical protein
MEPNKSITTSVPPSGCCPPFDPTAFSNEESVEALLRARLARTPAPEAIAEIECRFGWTPPRPRPPRSPSS